MPTRAGSWLLTLKILANNQIRFKHSVGVRPRPGVDVDADNRAMLRHQAIGAASEKRSGAAALTTLQKINKDNAVLSAPCSDSFLASSKLFIPSPPDIFPGHSNWGRRQKPKKFRSFARDSISEACCVLDRIYDRDDLRFVTLTLPGSRFECLDVLSRYSGFLINRLRQIIRNSTIPSHDVFVWELQKRGALHLHWVIGASDPRFKFLSAVDVLTRKLKDGWYDLLLEIGDKEKIDMFARKGFGVSHKDNPSIWQWKIEKIKKSVSRYLSKYTSKGFNQNSGKTQSYTKIQARFSPSRWWGQSRNLLKEVQKYRFELKFDGLNTDECEEFINSIFASIPANTVSFFYSREWHLDDIGISGVTAGCYIDSGKFDYVCGLIADNVWNWYAKTRQASSDRSANISAGLRDFANVLLVKEKYQAQLDKEDCLGYSLRFCGNTFERNYYPATPKNSPMVFKNLPQWRCVDLVESVLEFGF